MKPKTLLHLVGFGIGFLVSFVFVNILIDPRANSHEPLFALDAWCYDRLLNLRASMNEDKRKELPDIFLVTFDESSFESLKLLENPRFAQWPWSPLLFAQVVDRLREFGVHVIGIDKLFVESHLLNDIENPTGQEAEFARACKEHGKVVLAGKIETSQIDQTSSVRQLVEPLPILLDAAELGIISLPIDPDNTVRRAFPFAKHQGNVYPSFSTQIVRLFRNWSESALHLGDSDSSKIGEITIPLHHETFYIGYEREPVQAFPFFLFVDGLYEMFSEYYFSGTGEEEAFDSERFQGSIVLMGATIGDLHDEFKTPVRYEPMPGVEIHANIVKTLLSSNFLRHVNDHVQIWMIFGISVLLCLLCSFASVRTGILGSVGGMLLWLGGGGLLFVYGGYVVRMVTPLVCIGLATSSTISYRYVFAEREKRYLKHLFSKATDARLVDLLLDNPELVKLGGEQRRITVLFSDIRSFSTISESMSPEVLIRFLNTYYSEVTDVIFRNQGMIDKYIGDAVMAIFGAPVPNEEHAYSACKAAVEVLDVQRQISEKWKKEGYPGFRIGIGIHTGNAVLGNLGSDKRSDYTSIGDAVNIASRIEGLNKEHKTEILISESTYREFSEWFDVREVGESAIRGRKGKVNLYELLKVYSMDWHHS